MDIEQVIEKLVADGTVSQAELDAKVAEYKDRSPIRQDIANLDDRTIGMQGIDDYTLERTSVLDEKTVGMQDVDDFTLALVFELQAKVAELEEKIATLQGGI